MKLTDKIEGESRSIPFYTFEFFPPRTDHGFENLVTRISRMSALNPTAISITWGAGGSTRDNSLVLAGLTQTQYGVDTILHLTCTNMKQGLVEYVLGAAKNSGIHNILALRGDPPRGVEEWIPSDPRFTHAIDLVKYIRASPEFSSTFCIGVAAYPDGHIDNIYDEDTELDNLKAKVDAGADFIITQLFYDVDRFLNWLGKVRAKGITVPVIPGIMPIQTFASFARLTKLCGTKVPESVSSALAAISRDDQLVKDYGVKLAVQMISRLRTEGDIPGVHFCTMNLEKSVKRVLETLRWTGTSAPVRNRLISDSVQASPGVEPIELLATATEATHSATSNLSTISMTEGEAGRGELNNAPFWDDFPNGRFGDFKSPAFGSQDPWGGSSVVSKGKLTEWGDPRTLQDLTQIFLDYLSGRISGTPFSPFALSPESLMILHQLEEMTKKGWWTVGSQPAVDGASSADELFGWGPRPGYVFQKGFVEFFCDTEDVDMLERRITENGKGWVHWFAGNVKGEFRSNVPDDGRNAVTWGIFPGQEVAQSTIIERESFLSWKDEAFSIWSDWASFYRPDAEERKLLESVKNDRWLVSIVHHDYKDTQALWTFLFDPGE